MELGAPSEGTIYLVVDLYDNMHIYVSTFSLPKGRKPPKERAVPVPSSSKETDKSTLGLDPSTAAEETPLEATQDVPVLVSSSNETSCCRQNYTYHDDDVVPVSPNVSSADLTEEIVELKKRLADMQSKYTELQHHATGKNTIQS